MKDLIPVKHNLKAANTMPIKINGAIIIRLSGTNDSGDGVEAAVFSRRGQADIQFWFGTVVRDNVLSRHVFVFAEEVF